ncbi:MAG: carboxypeptidase-like regulatory domain-containing protein [Bacteroidota bacterium]
MHKIVYIVLLLVFSNIAFSQQNEDLIQFSGVVVSGDGLKPVSYTTIIVQKTRKGTISDFNGFFSFVAKKGDIIEFTAVGFKPVLAKIPDSLKTNRYSLIQILSTDTVMLSETVIHPWYTYEQFKIAVVKTNPPEDDYDRAIKNIELVKLKEQLSPMARDGSLNYKDYIRQQTNRYYTAGGQMQPNNLLNPFAWAKFIEAWQNGDFKRKY